MAFNTFFQTPLNCFVLILLLQCEFENFETKWNTTELLRNQTATELSSTSYASCGNP